MPILKPSPADLYGSGLFRAGGARSLMRMASLVVLTVAALLVSIVSFRPAFAQPTDSLTGSGAAALRACIGGDNVSFTQKIDGRLIYAREIFGSGSGTQALRSDSGPIIYTMGYHPRDNKKYIDAGEVANITLSIGGGARFHDPITASDVRTYDHDGTEISDATNVERLSGGNVGDDRVAFEFAFNGKDGVDKIMAGSTIVFTIPPLAVTDFSPSRSVTITTAVRSVATAGENYFPAGPAGRCLSDASNDGSCVYARAIPYVQHLILGPRMADSKYPLSPSPSDTNRASYLIGAQENTKVDILVGGAGFAPSAYEVNTNSQEATIQSLYIPSGVAGLIENTTKDAVLLGQVRIFAGSTESLRSQTACDQLKYGTDDLVRPLKADGTPFRPSEDDVIELAVTPDIDQNRGHYIYRQIRIGNRQVQGALRDMAEDGTVRIRMTDLAPLGLNSQYGNEEWEIFFVPGNANFEHGDNYTFRARALFDGAPHATVNSEPASRSVAMALDGLMPNAVAYAIPPPSSPDEAFVRIRCENRDAPCDVFLDCSNQVGDSWFARMEQTVASGGTTVLTRAGIAEVLSSQGFDPDTHWGGTVNGRLACEILSTAEGMLSSQVLVRSGDGGPLTNNTHVNSSSPQIRTSQ